MPRARAVVGSVLLSTLWLAAASCGRDAGPPAGEARAPEADRRWISVCVHVDPDPSGRRVPDALARAGIRCYAQGSLNVATWYVPMARRARAVEVLRTDPTTADAWVMDEADATIEFMALPIELPEK
ncbi:MAG: hypothetical protein U1E39_13790 [Planctomycetota bacterium]